MYVCMDLGVQIIELLNLLVEFPYQFYILFFGNTLTHEILNGTVIRSSPRAFFSQMRTSSMMANGPNANHHGGSLFASLGFRTPLFCENTVGGDKQPWIS